MKFMQVFLRDVMEWNVLVYDILIFLVLDKIQMELMRELFLNLFTYLKME